MENIIFYFLCFLIEAIILGQYASSLFFAKRSRIKRLSVLYILYTILFIVSLFNFNVLNMSLYLLFNFIYLITQYTLKYHSAFFHSAILAAVMGMCELIVYSIIEHFTPRFFVDIGKFNNTILFIIFSKILFFSIIYFLIYLQKGKKKFGLNYDNSINFLIFIPITTIIVMLTFIHISDLYTLTTTLDYMISLSSVLLLAINLLIFGINQNTQRKTQEYMEMQLLLQKETDTTEYYKMLLSQNENKNILIHDIKKHLQSIELLNNQNAPGKITEYIQQLLLSSELKENSRICDRELLNAILSRYKRQCEEKNINFLADIRNETTDFIEDNALTSLFCNLLDNSIESACNIPDSFIEINTRKKAKTPFVIITVINSCIENPFISQNNILTTSKPNKHEHGYGIKSIRKIVNKYHGNLQMYYNNDTLSFHTIITLKQYSN